MAGVLEFLMEILCQQGTVGQCQEFVSGYADPVQQVLFFLLFPSLFLLIFITEVTVTIRAIPKKYGFVMSVAIFVYIIVQGWFHYFLLFGKFWFFTIVILGGLWVMISKMGVVGGAGGGGGGGEGGKGEKRPRDNWLQQALIGTKTLDPRERAASKKVAEEELKSIRERMDYFEKRLKDTHPDAKEREAYAIEISKLVNEENKWKRIQEGKKPQ